MYYFLVFILGVLLFFSSPSSNNKRDISAATVEITPFTGTQFHSLYVGPVTYNHSLMGPYNSFGEKSSGHFFISQWSNPIPFIGTTSSGAVTPPNPQCRRGGDKNSTDFASEPLWSIENPTLRVCALKSLARSDQQRLLVQLAQSGGNALSCGPEFDLFLAPNSFDQYPINNNRANNNKNPVTLDRIQSVDLSFGVELVYSAVKRRCSAGKATNCGPGGEVDYMYVTLGLPLSNPTAKQTIFYQILLFDTRTASGECGSSFETCSPTSNNEGTWYFSTLPTLGVNFNIGTFLIQQEQPCLNLNTGTRSAWYNSTTFNQTAFLAKLRKSVADAAARFGADGNEANWIVQDWYLGSGMQRGCDVDDRRWI